ncbi:MAG: SagB/ThcOx family dehydrogenase [Methylococcaceae bacterium]|nr:MAG: SagB/ThcOx family dehydrogenase [Methylococcaceae bacterium]
MTDAAQAIRAYHQRSKHAPDHYAAGPGFLDWDTQPDPFRRWEGADQTTLPLAADQLTTLYAELFQPGAVAPAPLGLDSLGALLELSFGLSAWKQAGADRWALRCNPSSGNLHPTEAYVVTAGVAELADGVHHYQSYGHLLERRCAATLPYQGLLLGLSSVHWREAWKYGERAFRYCQHDVGHALAALRYAAAALGWRVRLLDDWSDADIAALLGLDRDTDFAEAEHEAPDVLCAIDVRAGAAGMHPPTAWTDAVRAGCWQGQANRLSRGHRHPWPAIDAAAQAAAKPRTAPAATALPALPALSLSHCEAGAAALIQQRRSAQAFDGVSAIPALAFYRILDATLPRPDAPPFDCWPWPPRLHLLLFVHRVSGLEPGLYLLCRSADGESALRDAVKTELEWLPVTAAPSPLRLFRLAQANARHAAKTLSCHQDIAADGVFSLGMLAEFDAALAEGAWVYRRLFWESGLIGQALYLAAEAAGVRGTGIGCYFDDAVHALLGLQDSRLQSLYHFTVGAPLLDRRLQTLPPYGHRQR